MYSQEKSSKWNEIIKRSGVSKWSYGEFRGCLTDTRSQTLTWNQICVCVVMCLCMHICHYVCMLAACVHVSGDPGSCWWRNQVRESSYGHKLPFHPRSLSHQSVVLAASHLNAQSLITDMLLSAFVCLCFPGKAPTSNSVPVPALSSSFCFSAVLYTFVLVRFGWVEGVS